MNNETLDDLKYLTRCVERLNDLCGTDFNAYLLYECDAPLWEVSNESRTMRISSTELAEVRRFILEIIEELYLDPPETRP